MDDQATRRLCSKAQYGPLCDMTLESALKREILTNFGFENMPIVADMLIQRFMEIVNKFSPEKTRFLPYQTIIIGVDKNEKFGYGKRMTQVKLCPAIVNLITPGELNLLADGVPLRKLRPRILVRILKECYQQRAVISFTLLATLLVTNPSSISRAVQLYKKEHPDDTIPHSGTIFDMGRSMSHKIRALELMYQGLLTREIAFRINHHHSNVSRYLQDHKRIVEAYEAGHSFQKICFLTGLTPGLVREHINYYKNVKERLNKLRASETETTSQSQSMW